MDPMTLTYIGGGLAAAGLSIVLYLAIKRPKPKATETPVFYHETESGRPSPNNPQSVLSLNDLAPRPRIEEVEHGRKRSLEEVLEDIIISRGLSSVNAELTLKFPDDTQVELFGKKMLLEGQITIKPSNGRRERRHDELEFVKVNPETEGGE